MRKKDWCLQPDKSAFYSEEMSHLDPDDALLDAEIAGLAMKYGLELEKLADAEQ